jgi:hypothetical protein
LVAVVAVHDERGMPASASVRPRAGPVRSGLIEEPRQTGHRIVQSAGSPAT